MHPRLTLYIWQVNTSLWLAYLIQLIFKGHLWQGEFEQALQNLLQASVLDPQSRATCPMQLTQESLLVGSY